MQNLPHHVNLSDFAHWQGAKCHHFDLHFGQLGEVLHTASPLNFGFKYSQLILSKEKSKISESERETWTSASY